MIFFFTRDAIRQMRYDLQYLSTPQIIHDDHNSNSNNRTHYYNDGMVLQ